MPGMVITGEKENPTNLYLDGVSLTDNLTKGYINAKALSGYVRLFNCDGFGWA